MKREFFILSSVFFLSSSIFVNAQNEDTYLHCGTDQAQAQVFLDHPELKAEFEERDRLAEAQDAFDFQNGYKNSSQSNRNDQNSVQTNPNYLIPVVFHIIHDYGSENISDAQVFDEMRILNNDYRKLNSDISAVRAAFTGIAADALIEFRLANKDPNGNCTNGIDRIYSQETYIGDDGSKLNDWPRNKYLNVWVVKTISSGAAGYAYLPGGAPSSATDGIMILNTYIGSIGTSSTSHSRALTHEIGHFLNLKHVWGSTNTPGVTCGNDGVNDTPVTKGWTACVSSSASKVCSSTIEENVQNYMEYSYCSCMFTAGQKTRMASALNSTTGQRNSLWTTTNQSFTGISLSGTPIICTPTADFIPNAKTMICAGGSVTFTDITWNGHPTSWLWSFPGGTPSTSTDSIPVIQYNTAGSYNATLTATNSAGANTITRNNVVLVSPTTPQYNAGSYSEGLENATTFANDWVIINPTGNGWARTTSAAATGTASAKITNTAASLGQLDDLISPSFDLTAIANPVFTFKVAFAQRTSGDLDRLRVYVSTDCGETWTMRFSKSGTPLSTVSATTSSFTPTSSQWRTETVSMTSIVNANNVRVKFEFESGGGNNIYLDDINIISVVSGINAPELGVNKFVVFPNPVQSNTMISFTSENSQDVTIQLFDMTGREVMNVFSGNLNAGNHQFPIQTEGILGSGIYFVRLTNSEGISVTQKMVVE